MVRTEIETKNLKGLGNYYYAVPDFKNSLKYFLKAVEVDKTFGRSWAGCGFCARGLQNYEDAVKYFAKSIETPKDAQENRTSFPNIAECLMRLQRNDEALLWCWKGMQQSVDNTNDWINYKVRGHIRLKMRLIYQSTTDMLGAFLLHPGDKYHRHCDLGEAYSGLGLHELAVMNFRIGRKLLPLTVRHRLVRGFRLMSQLVGKYEIDNNADKQGFTDWTVSIMKRDFERSNLLQSSEKTEEKENETKEEKEKRLSIENLMKKENDNEKNRDQLFFTKHVALYYMFVYFEEAILSISRSNYQLAHSLLTSGMNSMSREYENIDFNDYEQEFESYATLCEKVLKTLHKIAWNNDELKDTSDCRNKKHEKNFNNKEKNRTTLSVMEKESLKKLRSSSKPSAKTFFSKIDRWRSLVLNRQSLIEFCHRDRLDREFAELLVFLNHGQSNSNVLPGRAMNFVNEAIEVSPNVALYHKNRAGICIGRGVDKSVSLSVGVVRGIRKDLEIARRCDEKLPGIYWCYAQLYMREELWDDAQSNIEKGLSLLDSLLEKEKMEMKKKDNTEYVDNSGLRDRYLFLSARIRDEMGDVKGSLENLFEMLDTTNNNENEKEKSRSVRGLRSRRPDVSNDNDEKKRMVIDHVEEAEVWNDENFQELVVEKGIKIVKKGMEGSAVIVFSKKRKEEEKKVMVSIDQRKRERERNKKRQWTQMECYKIQLLINKLQKKNKEVKKTQALIISLGDNSKRVEYLLKKIGFVSPIQIVLTGNNISLKFAKIFRGRE